MGKKMDYNEENIKKLMKYNISLGKAAKLFNVSYMKLFSSFEKGELEGAVIFGTRKTSEEAVKRFMCRTAKLVMPKESE